MENNDAGELGQYIEEMHRMMSKASRRLLLLAERELSREDQKTCLKVCIELLQGVSYQKYLKQSNWVLKSYDASMKEEAI